MKGFKNLSKTEIENLSTEDFIDLLKQQLLAGPQQIYQFPNKPTVVGNDLFLISSTNSGNITNNTSTSQYLTNYINPNVQLGSVSQVTGLPAILSSIDLQYAYNNTAEGNFIVNSSYGISIQDTDGNFLLSIVDSGTEISATSAINLTSLSAETSFQFSANVMTNQNQGSASPDVDLLQIASQGYTGTETLNSSLFAFGFVDVSLPSGYIDFRITDSNTLNTMMRMQGTQGSNPACIIMGGTSSSATISNLSINASSINYNSLLQLESTTQGWLPSRLTSTQEDTLIAIPLTSSDQALSWYNTTNNVNKYWDGLDVQTVLTIDNVIQGSNMVITDNGDGTLTFAATGGSGPSTQVQGSFNANQTIATTTPATTADTPIVIFPAFFNSINPVGTNVSVATISGVQTAIIQNNSTGGRWCQVDYDLTIYVPTAGQIYTFTIYTNTGATVYFKKYQALGTGPYYDDIAICGKMIYLNTNDYVYLTVNSSSPSGPAIAAFYYSGRLIDTTVASLPNTNALSQGSNNLWLSQNGGTTYQYMSGSGVIGNIPKFNSTGGQFIDSGIAASNIVLNNGSTYGINISGNSATVTTNANLTGPITSTGNATTVTASSITNAMLAGSIDLTTKVINVLPNSNTTATSANTASAIVTRDTSGNFSAGTIAASLSGTATNTTQINGIALGSTTATSGNLLIGSGSQWVSNAMSGNITINSSGVTTIGSNQVTNSMLAGSIDLTTKVIGILPAGNGGSGNAFFQISGPTTSIKTFTLPNASANILTDNAFITVAQGGTGQTTYTNGQLLIGNTTGNTLTKATLTGTTNQITVSNGSGSITLSTPQNIDSGANPTFSSLTLSTTGNAINLQNDAALRAQNSSGTYETFMFPRFSDNYMYIDVGSSGIRWRQNGGTQAFEMDNSGNITLDQGNLTIGVAGKGYNIKGGSNARVGSGAVLVTGTVTITTSAVATGDIILPTCTTAGGTQGIIRTSISNGVSFTLTSSNASDTSTYAWVIIRPT